eukprot:gnl/TRDRNA2_/TRDRNA2_42720_c0_seq1.p1 gnl/TRDRNA2_/TRDRNA2_42720_c0~~gnl/TRDRNA2_/TRDRNA2_42720_c0_seq1.p1  ORF type:complete len:212 (+),score=42.24 gnl/TRDRNA2_/TRDRNA2_42720_c0_seq1:59-637(+)
MEGFGEESSGEPWYKVLGDTLVTKEGPKPTADVIAGKKLVGLYFSGGWCPPCKRFTPKLAELYGKRDPSEFEVLFLTACNDEAQFKEYHAGMPWPAVPYEVSQGTKEQQGAGFVRKAKRDDGLKQGVLGEKYAIASVPRLVLVDAQTGKAITEKGHETTPAEGDTPETYQWYEPSANEGEAGKTWAKLTSSL